MICLIRSVKTCVLSDDYLRCLNTDVYKSLFDDGNLFAYFGSDLMNAATMFGMPLTTVAVMISCFVKILSDISANDAAM